MQNWKIVAIIAVVGIVFAGFIQTPSKHPDSKESGLVTLLFWGALVYFCYRVWHWAMFGN